MTNEILITVRDRIPVVTNKLDVITFNSDYKVKFDFDAEWDKYPQKLVYFVQEDGKSIPMLMSGNICDFPVISEERRRIFIGVQAGNLKTTRPCQINIVDSIADYLCNPIAPPTPDIYNQIIDMLNQKIDTPAVEGVAGQVLGLDSDLNPTWMNQTRVVVNYDDTTGELTIGGSNG